MKSALSTTLSESFHTVHGAKGSIEPPHVMLYGDDARAKEVAFGLARVIGFERAETGGLHNVRNVESFALAMDELAHIQPRPASWA
ncbi:hypothetical protein GCM10011415_29380 [Salipiger pallidus]|uniref:Uncharacterized protein n=1 Tax=Salipiger pallidus TaxID=1775170 RepID=A0A8J3EHI1_9RHOB|nr:hypothetical protein [Salipiger pallidus]GGG78512.1 hypothetical protein GCM10011415_29380 [Salipiger pallidus]